jgi:hypothetical protein
MDILASMLAYLGCVTGIVAALVMSFFVFFSTPDQPAVPKHTVALASKASASRPGESKVAMSSATATAADATPASKLGPKIGPMAAGVASGAPKAETVPQAASAAHLRPRAQIGRAQYLRRLVQEERARRWAYQQDPDFDSRFLGYAD